MRTPIDNFILAEIEKANLTPSPEADKVTLIRRLSLDLVGLPPTLKEIDEFVADSSPDADEKLVERLLASPHYGERWGRHWLDTARYADTNGFEKDRERSIWPYRDWVIKAINQDMPFDRFTIEQLAGDLLPPKESLEATLDQRIATGFLRNSMLNEEGAVEFREGSYSTGSGSDLAGSEKRHLRGNPLATARGTDSAAWSLKNIHRLIVNSAVYRQSSRITPQMREKLQQADPNNRLLARAPRLRVEAEIVRDIALATSGLLSLKIGGPSVFPPIPDGAMAISFRSRTVWETSKGEDKYRRGMYTFWKRSVPYPALSVFDAPNADLACTRRIRSNTPLQALTTLNDAVFMEAAQTLALRVWKEGGADDKTKMVYAFRLCTGRAPDEFELNRLLRLLEQQHNRFKGQTAAAVYVSTPDLNNLPPEIDLHELAPWTMVARVLLNLDETIARQ